MTNHTETLVTLVYADGTLSQGSKFMSVGFARECGMKWSRMPEIRAAIVATGQQGAICYVDGQSTSLAEVIRIQNELVIR